jgi:type III restriction enzyme
MRMPYAKTRKSPKLNKAYASVVSPHFEEAAAALVEKLKNKGFDENEAAATIQWEPPKVTDLDPNWNWPDDQYQPETKLKPSDIPPSMLVDENNTLHFSEATTDEDIKKVSGKIKQHEAADLIWKFNIFKRLDKTPSPAAKGIPFNVPRLMFEVQGELQFASPEIIFETFDWNAPRLLETEFTIGETEKGFYIDIDGNRLTYSYAGNEPFLPHLSETRRLSLANLMIAKYTLNNRLSAKITAARQMGKFW